MTTDRTADALGAIADRLDDLWQLLDARLPPSEVMDDAAIARIKKAVMDCVAQKAAQDGENAPLPDVQPSEGSQGTPTPTDAPEPAQTLADLEPRLGDRVRAYRRPGIIEDFTYGHHAVGGYGWSAWLGQSVVMEAWTVLDHLDPVTPEEPPVGAGMLVDANGSLWRREDEGWRYLASTGAWSPACSWSILVNPGHGFDGYRLRPATHADLAAHGVDEQGEPVGKGEADEDVVTVKRIHLEIAQEWYDDGALETEGDITAYRAIRDALKAGER